VSAGLKVISGTVTARIRVRAFLFICLLIVSAYRELASAGQIDKGKLYGGIEVASEGIKAAAIRVSDVEQRSGLEVVFTEQSDLPLIQTKNGMLDPKVIKATAQEVLKLYTRMQQQFQVPPGQIYIIGNSNLKADNLEELSREVRDKTGKEITLLSLESDVRLSIVGTIPRRSREGETAFDNRSLSVLIDIGVNKTKGGYQQIRQPLVGSPRYDFVAVGISRGTVNFANEVNQAVGEEANLKRFAFVAKMFGEGTIQTDFRSELRNELTSKPGLAYRKKVYLCGGIVWAMVTLLYPEDRRPFVPITVEDIKLFHQRAVNSSRALLNPDLSRIRDGEIRKEVERELVAVRSNFTPKNLIAGTEILKAVAVECHFQEEGKKIMFARYGHLSLILTYVRMQAESGPES
jgi:hypothetical protein